MIHENIFYLKLRDFIYFTILTNPNVSGLMNWVGGKLFLTAYVSNSFCWSFNSDKNQKTFPQADLKWNM